MLNISIKPLQSLLNKPEAAKKFAQQRITVTEKFDGTKLSLIRTNSDFDYWDYRKNWIVSYRGNILYAEEGYGTPGHDYIREMSLGCAQYEFIHSWLRHVHSETKSFPKNFEFQFEFIQNKLTLTRDYKRKFGIYLIQAAPVQYHVHDFDIITYPGDVITDRSKLTEWAIPLQISLPPILMSGDLISGGVLPPKEYVKALITLFSNQESVLGGPAEGVVIQVGKDFYKIVRSDQYDVETRLARKSSWQPRPDYWNDVHDRADKYLSGTMNLDLHSAIEKFSRAAYVELDISLKEQEDTFLTAKLAFANLLLLGNKVHKNVAVYPIAGKPVHEGHWKVIEILAQGCDHLVVFVSIKDRDKDGLVTGKNMLNIWEEFLIPKLPHNVRIKFTDSPVREMYRFLKTFEVSKFDAFAKPQLEIATGDDAVLMEDDVKKNLPDLYEKKRIFATTLQRSKVSDISGTKMRFWLSQGKRTEFIARLPHCLSDGEKNKIWNILSAITC